jgi:TolB-like protein/Tfp pilus assembly protein PilF
MTMRTPAPRLESGTTFAGRYQVIEDLGMGGMGRVYKVFDLTVGEKVALKLLNPEIAGDEEMIARFRDELRLARTISHRNVCRMHDLGRSDGEYYITMEFVPGETLKAFVRRSGRLTVDKAVGVAAQVCEGLAEAHRAGIIHRDLKPQNIMIDAEGNARIMDFGIARSLKSEGATGPGTIIGTPEYMPPEQVDGKPADERSDIYAVGAILFEMLTGRPPFAGPTPLATALMHKTEAPPDPRTLNDLVPESLSRVVLRCLEKERDKRYSSAADLLADLKTTELRPAPGESAAARARTPGEATGQAAGAPAPRRVGRGLGLAMAGAALFALILIALFFIVFPRSRRTEPPGAATPAWKNSVAVLPFVDRSPAKDQEGICDALSESVIIRLSQFPELKVSGTNSVQRFKNTDKDARQVGRELGVSSVLFGTLQREGDTVRVSAELTSGETNAVIWSNRYDQKLENLFDLYDRISGEIARALEVKLLPGPIAAPAEQRPRNLQAYEYTMKGMSFIKSRYVLYFKEDDFRTGVEMCNKAIELDPSYALPYFGLCWAYEYHYQVTSSEADAELMQKNAEIAMRLDPDSPLTNVAQAYALYEYKGERDRAFELVKKALASNSNLGDVVFLAGMCYLYHGLYEQGIRYLSRAIELDPYNFWAPYKLAMCYAAMGEYEKADLNFQKYFELAPPLEPLVYPGRNICLQIMMKRYDKADQLVRRGEKTTPDAEWVRKYRALLLAVRGDRAGALALYRNSDVYALLGMKDEAFRELDKEIRGTVFIPYIYYQDLIHNPFYDKLRDDARFEKLVAREKTLYDEALRKYAGL